MGAASDRADGDALAFELRQSVQGLIRGIKDPKWVSVHDSQRQHFRRALPVRDASKIEGNLNSRVWILQKLDVVHRAVSFEHLQLNVRSRKNVAVSLTKVF